MSEGKKVCPYCGEEILDVATKCKFCGETLPDQNVSGEGLPYVKKIPTVLFCILGGITYGLYYYYWVISRTFGFNKIARHGETINMIVPIAYILCAIFSYIIYLPNSPISMDLGLLFMLNCCILNLIICYNMLIIIEDYAYRTTGKKIKHHPFFWWFFNILYVNFAINNYKERVSRA